MRKLFFGLLAIGALAANGDQISVEQAMGNARAFLTSQGSGFRAPANMEMRLVKETANTYIFNISDKGYVIASGDDDFEAVLAYSDEGTFNPNDIPLAMQDLLDNYDREMAWARENGRGMGAAATAENTYEDIEPLLTTRWGQDYPFNIMTPIRGQATHCTTGCVATAMAQVMNYHEWPKTGVGSHSYTTKIAGSSTETTIESNFSEHTYDWANMIDYYEGSGSTDRQNNAVAQLMFDCGVGVEMEYGSLSYAYSTKIPYALRTYFNYGPVCQIFWRYYYSLNKWIEMCHKSLKECGPIIYAGESTAGAHEFVLDGFKNNQYFHVNWGWYGKSNGYFLLTALKPDTQGTGGSGHDYNSGQEAVLNIRPPKGEGEKAEGYLLASGAAKLYVSGTSSSITYSQSYNSSLVYNPLYDTYEYKLVDIVVDYFTGETVKNVFLPKVYEFPYNKGLREISLKLAGEGLEPGAYKVFGGYAPADNQTDVKPIMVPAGMKDFVMAIVDEDGTVRYANDATGVDAVKAEDDGNVTIYNLMGVKVYEGAKEDCTLPSGLYISKGGDKFIVK